MPSSDALEEIYRGDFRELRSIHWGIECYHRAIKQLYGIKRFLVITPSGILTHFFCSLRAVIQLELMRAEELIENWYQIQRNLFIQVARNFILEHLQQKVGIHTNF